MQTADAEALAGLVPKVWPAMLPQRRARVLKFYGLLGDDHRELFGALEEGTREDLARDAWNHNPRRAYERLLYLTPDPRDRPPDPLEGLDLEGAVELLGSRRHDHASLVPQVAQMFMNRFGAEQAYRPLFESVCNDLTSRALPAGDVVKAIRNAAGPDVEKPRGVFWAEIKRARKERGVARVPR